MLDHVGQRLLHDPVGREVDAGRQRARLALDRERDVDARAAGALDQPGTSRTPGAGASSGASSPCGRSTSSMRCISVSASRPIVAICAPAASRSAPSSAPERLRLHDHQADAVGDDVVELARDPHALRGDRLLGQQQLLALELGGAVVQRREVGGARGREVEAAGDRQADRDEVRETPSAR